MARDTKRLHEVAADIIEECGEYARMAALFLANEARESGDAEDVVFWTRIAHVIMEGRAQPPGGARLH